MYMQNMCEFHCRSDNKIKNNEACHKIIKKR